MTIFTCFFILIMVKVIIFVFMSFIIFQILKQCFILSEFKTIDPFVSSIHLFYLQSFICYAINHYVTQSLFIFLKKMDFDHFIFKYFILHYLSAIFVVVQTQVSIIIPNFIFSIPFWMIIQVILVFIFNQFEQDLYSFTIIQFYLYLSYSC